MITAYFKAYLALTRPATSSHFTSGFCVMIASLSLLVNAYLPFFPFALLFVNNFA
jgi:hypothetical protein